MFGLFKYFKRKKLLKRSFPDEWIAFLNEHVPFYAQFIPEQKQIFHENLKLFVWERHFVGAGGMEITDEVKVVIAASAVRLIQYLDLSYYDRIKEIIVYPSHYKHPGKRGIVFGEANRWGFIVLSWEAVLTGLKNPDDAHNTAFHEFAHVLDRSDGLYDGTPPLHAREHYRPYAGYMTLHFNRLRKGGRCELKALRSYGAKNEAEFFAVLTEAFFENPETLKKCLPDLYCLMTQFYKFDPLTNKEAANLTCG